MLHDYLGTGILHVLQGISGQLRGHRVMSVEHPSVLLWSSQKSSTHRGRHSQKFPQAKLPEWAWAVGLFSWCSASCIPEKYLRMPLPMTGSADLLCGSAVLQNADIIYCWCKTFKGSSNHMLSFSGILVIRLKVDKPIKPASLTTTR